MKIIIYIQIRLSFGAGGPSAPPKLDKIIINVVFSMGN